MKSKNMFLTQLLAVCASFFCLNAVKIKTASCLDKSESKFLQNGSMCNFTCEIDGLEDGQYWTIEKTHFVHRELTSVMEIKDPFQVFLGNVSPNL